MNNNIYFQIWDTCKSNICRNNLNKCWAWITSPIGRFIIPAGQDVIANAFIRLQSKIPLRDPLLYDEPQSSRRIADTPTVCLHACVAFRTTDYVYQRSLKLQAARNLWRPRTSFAFVMRDFVGMNLRPRPRSSLEWSSSMPKAKGGRSGACSRCRTTLPIPRRGDVILEVRRNAQQFSIEKSKKPWRRGSSHARRGSSTLRSQASQPCRVRS